jgi:hypothetical protein
MFVGWEGIASGEGPEPEDLPAGRSQWIALCDLRHIRTRPRDMGRGRQVSIART